MLLKKTRIARPYYEDKINIPLRSGPFVKKNSGEKGGLWEEGPPLSIYCGLSGKNRWLTNQGRGSTVYTQYTVHTQLRGIKLAGNIHMPNTIKLGSVRLERPAHCLSVCILLSARLVAKD